MERERDRRLILGPRLPASKVDAKVLVFVRSLLGRRHGPFTRDQEDAHIPAMWTATGCLLPKRTSDPSMQMDFEGLQTMTVPTQQRHTYCTLKRSTVSNALLLT